MTVSSYHRGWRIELKGEKWVYSDTKEPCFLIKNERPCKRCGRFPTSEGHDACLGKLPNALAACCGHGVKKPYVIF